MQKNLFGDGQEKSKHTPPLAVRMRPRAFEDFVGQGHIVGEGRLLRRALAAQSLSSLILYGPPGTGKTALAYLIAGVTKARFESVNAVTSNLAELKPILHTAQRAARDKGQKTILFIDEIHRFNKAQQDSLMPFVEEGVAILIGATTHNPFFSIVSPLLSRSLIFEFEPLLKEDLKEIGRRALKDCERGLGGFKVQLDADALDFLADVSDGDARRLLNALEIGVKTTAPEAGGAVHLTCAVAQESIQKKAVRYDRDEDQHYDAASAFIKSMRGSDPDATIYWLAKMLYAGEDPRFIARRIAIAAAEDVGNADPQALVVAASAVTVSEFVGLPEARIPLAQAALYIACAPKSNASYLAISHAEKDIKEGRSLEVPAHLKDASYKGAARLGHGKGYQYAHDFKGHHVKQDYLAEPRTYYEPTQLGFESIIKERLKKLRETSSS
ncbi:MAG: replication-associated recombination protein A [Candidatus Omnitrophica bacterium]|nr:replication-associated recombination protein A [Candidatus Omnitrophota bacterium]